MLRGDIERFCLDLERNHPGVPAATILNHFYTLFREREELGRQNGEAYEALREIAAMPEQGGCGDGIDAVDLWMLMQKRAQRAVDALDGIET